jgi:hypothetical protein
VRKEADISSETSSNLYQSALRNIQDYTLYLNYSVLRILLDAFGKKLQVTFTLQVNLADHGYVLAHTYTCHTYLFA